LATLKPEELAVTIISYEEQTRGWLQLIAQVKTSGDELLAYQRLEKHIQTFARLPVVGYNEKAIQQFQHLRQRYRRLGKMDLKIAAIAISLNATLLTRNLQDFGQISELNATDWSQ
jgi:tRNA(fMet)-specific endonuclease VapC